MTSYWHGGKVAGLSQRELARALGTSISNVGALEHGRIHTLRPEWANIPVRVLPLTMEEILQAQGYDLAERSRPPTAPADILAALEEATPLELDAVRALLRGWREPPPGPR